MEWRGTFVVTDAYDGHKLIHFLRGSVGLSSHLVTSLKRLPDGILRNGEHIRTIDRVSAGDVIGIVIPDDESTVTPLPHELDIIYEDESVLIINKQAGLAMHPTHNHQGDTLANAVAAYLEKKGRSLSFRAVGRLDKGTSGLVVCALNRFAASFLSGRIAKEYLAVATGIFEGEGTVEVPIYRPNPMKTLRACGEVEGCESAVTHWEALSRTDKTTLLKIHLETGRTHQIRVHFAHLGAPLVGDDMYGAPAIACGHQLLHCSSVSFVHPMSKEQMVFTAPPPSEFDEFIIPES